MLVFQFGFAVSSQLTSSHRPRMWFLFVTWRVLARMRLTTSTNLRLDAKKLGGCQLNDAFAGFLSTDCYLTAVALASYSI